MYKNRFLGFFLMGISLTFASCVERTSEPHDVLMVSEFELSDITLAEGPFRKSMDVNLEYLLNLDADRFLRTFRDNAGLSSASESYGGWEDDNIDIRGHSIGHYLSAMAKKYAITGDERLLDRGNYTVNELAECQQELNSRGYLMAVPETLFDSLESGAYVWAPYYVFHKILAGMIDQYKYAGNNQALKVAERMAEWVDWRTGQLMRTGT